MEKERKKRKKEMWGWVLSEVGIREGVGLAEHKKMRGREGEQGGWAREIC